ncbi:hypothetical protein [Paracoccus sp. PAR01]|uniref:hypothetical protein n=1 Tax=Paracoccus sp. PAR01 TaxID=2769282 RepID=UPI0017806159|nr:hypothetical protein [Paracoccus sp. PAR01]MBD9528992.1 hypothetical protein [Paracoccus sp. PAR01]
MTEWKSMETAPQDGQPRLYCVRVHNDHRPAPIVAADDGRWLIDASGAAWEREWATHWASLPSIPEGWTA